MRSLKLHMAHFIVHPTPQHLCELKVFIDFRANLCYAVMQEILYAEGMKNGQYKL